MVAVGRGEANLSACCGGREYLLGVEEEGLDLVEGCLPPR